MPLFGKKGIEKALEQRATLLQFIQGEIRVHAYPTDGSRNELLGELETRLLNNEREILLIHKEDEIKTLLTLPDSLGAMKYYFLMSVYSTASFARAGVPKESQSFYDLAADAASYLVAQMVDLGAQERIATNYEAAANTLHAALKIARKRDNAGLTVGCLRELAQLAADTDKLPEARAYLIEANNAIDALLARPNSVSPKGREMFLATSEELSGHIQELSSAIS